MFLKRSILLFLLLGSLHSIYGQQATTTLCDDAFVINTNFALPLVRFNFDNPYEGRKSLGNVTFFNSDGTGVSFSYRKLELMTDSNTGEVIRREFKNIIVIQLGFLFSTNTGDSSRNIFASILGLTILDSQIGYGYELGTIRENKKRRFLALSYSIPLPKLINNGLYIFKKSQLTQNSKRFI